MVINNKDRDKIPISTNDITVKYSATYVYLGAVITDDGSFMTSIDCHIKYKRNQVLKYLSFLKRNPDFPFPIKKLVADACLLSSVLNGCETWMFNNFTCINSLYMKVIKAMLSVRNTTCNDVSLLESGMPTLSTRVQQKRACYLQKLIPSLKEDDPLAKVMQIVRRANTASYRLIQVALNIEETRIREKGLDKLKAEIESNTTSSKRKSYVSMNPRMEVHPVYLSSDVEEYKRISFTRFRLSSHRLKN